MKIPGPDPKILDDLARVAGGAVNVLSGIQEQIRNDINDRMNDMAARLDLVPRDEMDQARAMMEKMRLRIDALEARIDSLEKGKSPAAKPAAKKPATKKTLVKKPASKKPAAKTATSRKKNP